MTPRTTAGLMVLVLLSFLAGGCNNQPPITFRLTPQTNSQQQSLSDLNLMPPHLSAAPSRWEYKVMKAQAGGEQELTKFLNEQSREGWEFVGQLQTKEHYLVLRRPKQPRDYIRSSGDLTPPDLIDETPTGKPNAKVVPGASSRHPRSGSARSSTKRDTRPTGLPRLGDNPER